MTFHEVVKSLRYICDVLKEYVATEERKRAEARMRAEEAARRRAEEAAAREAELKATQERLFARPAAKTTIRRRSRRGEGPRASKPIETRPAIPTVPADVFSAMSTDWGSGEHPLLRALPPALRALLAQLGQLHAAIRNLFSVTDASRRWFARVSADRRWGPAIHGLMSGLLILAERISRRMYHRDRFLAWQRRWIDNRKRVDRMFEGDWREKVRYILWTNGQRQARLAVIAA